MENLVGPYSTATEMAAALDRGEISSVELVELHIERIDQHDGEINAVPVRTFERARESALRADAARAAGKRAALLGLPITLKESTQVAGLPQSAGIPAFHDHQPTEDCRVAQRIFTAGGCLLGKTNVPVALADWQADSPVYGRTNNPWDLSRSPGGSTGGGGAALATGMTPLEIGSDIGGSIRVPAAFCGVYGHRPSETVIPREGAFPFAELPNPAELMGVQGPLARSAFDLELLFDVVAGPVVGEDAGWRLDLPPARGERLADVRVAIMPPLSIASASSEMHGKVDELASFASAAGATVGVAMPDVDHDAYFADYLALLTAMTSQGKSHSERDHASQAMIASGEPVSLALARGMVLEAHEYLVLLRRREQARAAWRAFFTEWDVLVAPTILDGAFPHQTGDQHSRTLAIDGRTVPYHLNLVYPMWAIFAGQPATAFPAGLSSAGLPLGLQAIGPYLEDRTTIRFAQLLERTWHSFVAPPAYPG